MMDSLANVHFIRPWWLLLAPVAVAVWWIWLTRTDPLRAWREQMDDDLLAALAENQGGSGQGRGHWLLTAWLVAVFAISGPTWRREPNPFAQGAPPLMILLKADASMISAGTTPTVLERGQLKIADLANVRQGELLGLIAYAGSAHLVLPPTDDTQAVADMAAQIRPDIMPVAGDRLDLAIREAWRVLSSGDSGGSILVIANSVQTDATAMTSAYREIGKLPVQFLALSEDDSPQFKTIKETAEAIGGSVEPSTVDDRDVSRLASRADRRSVVGAPGDSSRWQEAGYWLTPIVALAVALTFRRERSGVEVQE